MDDLSANIIDGTSRCPAAASTHQILLEDTRPVDPALLEQDYTYTSSADIPVSHYLSQAWFDLEVEHVWKKTWQVAGREEQIPNVGDYFIYNNVELSLIVARTAPDKISAFHNFCLHRGRKLKTEGGNAKEFKCAFHGFNWHIDGSIKDIPCRWDFEHLSDEDVKLREAKVGTWGGFIFVNFDLQCVELEKFLGKLPALFTNWRLEDRFMTAHVRKRLACNWKVGVEAFIEGFHTLMTHPQLAPMLADANSQYDNYAGENFNRMINPMGIQSPQLPPMTEDMVAGHIMGTYSHLKGKPFQLPKGETARTFAAEQTRKVSESLSGIDHSACSDSEMIDTLQYFVYPSFFPWGGYWPKQVIYIFRPDGNRPDSCYLEVMMLQRYDTSKPRPAAARFRLLRDDQKWADAEELRGFGPVFDQDTLNMALVQEGMKASTATKNAISLANYQECRIRDLHEWIERQINNGKG